MRKFYNKLIAASQFRVVSTYRITYAPEASRDPNLPIQVYTIAGNPKNLAWRSKIGNRLFTALLPASGKYASFRADRTLSVNFAGWRLLSPKLAACYRKTLAVG